MDSRNSYKYSGTHRGIRTNKQGLTFALKLLYYTGRADAYMVIVSWTMTKAIIKEYNSSAKRGKDT